MTADGELAVRSPDGDYTHRAPLAYQGEEDTKRPVGCRYVLYPDQTVGFELDAYDNSQPLVIDPVIEFMTYLGGDNQDFMLALDVDSFGNVVFGGITNSSNFPGVPASYNRTSIFVAKMNYTGTALLFTTVFGASTFMPGQGFIPLRDLEVDALGDIYITGANIWLDFPVTPGAYRSSGSGFVTKLSPTGEIQYSTFIDGPGLYSLAPVAIHARGGVAYVAGNALGFGFTGTADAYQKQIAGFTDIFALALNTEGSGLLFATAFGGTQSDELGDMAIDQGGNVILVGTSASHTLPVTNLEVPAPTFSQTNGFVARLNSQGSQLLSFGWLGPTIPNGVVVSPDGSFIVAGFGTLPAGLASLQRRPFASPVPGQPSGYILKRTPDDRTLWVTGVNSDRNTKGTLTIDSESNLYWVTNYGIDEFGYDSGGAFFTDALALPPDVSPPPPSFRPRSSLAVNKLSADGGTLLYSSRIPVVAPPHTIQLFFASYSNRTQWDHIWGRNYSRRQLANNTRSHTRFARSRAFWAAVSQ